MISQFDETVITGAAAAFGIFVVMQMIVFRLLHQEAVLKAIMVIFVLTSAVQVIGLSYVLTAHDVFLFAGGIITKVCLVGFSYLIFGLTAFVYILCVFGPSETSIRIRVVREIFEGPQHSLTPKELASRYNAAMILERRLDRLLRSGEIVLEQGTYRLIKKANFFFMIDSIANLIHRVIKRS
jgi:hypothetical protein